MKRRPSPLPEPSLLRPVPLQDLRVLQEPRLWAVDQPLQDLESLTPVRGWLSARHSETVLEVEGEAETIVTLCCDRCLCDYNHALHFRGEERLWLGEADQLGDDLAASELIECLDPRGDFDPARWLFEQLSLQLPLQNRCGPDCPGPALPDHPEAGEEASFSAGKGEPPIDPRWSALRQWR
ncbi:DUF177 domain-containing protein [Synechococcus sp. CBW1107]|uniref:YceD family protein n=1 Tax=unclassified Synechococcus TaxID=2626047 RepID=UPI0018CD4E53|nr:MULTISPECIES: DUF177 domain-containing protein [unclassified Synechococcus]QPN57223.1 DUF177 domain-containing protein [Synechococcus sp. CBW1107]CAK6693641.1 hypothetical protein BBFGKLBO_01481 [Synechococcus sp. CBW1107]